MTLTTIFLTRLALWSAALFTLLLVAGAGGGGTPWSTAARAPALAGFALILACFPAGVSVGARALADRVAFVREGVRLTAAALLVCGVAFGVIQWVAPAALAGGRVGPAADVEPRELVWATLRAQTVAAVRAAESTPEVDLALWRTANELAFEHERRLAHTSLPFLLTWLGLLAGHWAARIRSTRLRVAQVLAMGLYLLVSMYLGGENGYELVAVRAAGPAYFAAWFIVLVPAVLGLGLGWPALVGAFAGGAPTGTDGEGAP